MSELIRLRDIAGLIESVAPAELQESYDNSGVQLGNPDDQVNGALICIDVTEQVIDEAIELGVNLIISHHPLIFAGIKKIGDDATGHIIRKAIKHDIAIYSAHTNIDSITGGVSSRLADKLGLKEQKILQPRKDKLCKLVTFVPHAQAEEVRQALFDAGAGHIGNYDSCSYNITGQGSFRGGDHSKPYVGEKGVLHFEPETRIETIFPNYLEGRVINALLEAHPYEEVAYDIYPLKNSWDRVGFGVVGVLPEAMLTEEFLLYLKEVCKAGVIRHTAITTKEIRKVALCGGSGSFLLKDAIRAGADIFISGDFKYHQFFEAENKIIIADIGHYESEQFTKEVFCEILTKKFHNFALHLSQVNSNPIKYL